MTELKSLVQRTLEKVPGSFITENGVEVDTKDGRRVLIKNSSIRKMFMESVKRAVERPEIQVSIVAPVAAENAVLNFVVEQKQEEDKAETAAPAIEEKNEEVPVVEETQQGSEEKSEAPQAVEEKKEEAPVVEEKKEEAPVVEEKKEEEAPKAEEKPAEEAPKKKRGRPAKAK